MYNAGYRRALSPQYALLPLAGDAGGSGTICTNTSQTPKCAAPGLKVLLQWRVKAPGVREV